MFHEPVCGNEFWPVPVLKASDGIEGDVMIAEGCSARSRETQREGKDAQPLFNPRRQIDSPATLASANPALMPIDFLIGVRYEGGHVGRPMARLKCAASKLPYPAGDN
jgi:hypothetical protein